MQRIFNIDHKSETPSAAVWLQDTYDNSVVFCSPANSSDVTCSGLLLCAAGGHYLFSHGSSIHLSMQDIKHFNLLMKPSYIAMSSSSITGLNQRESGLLTPTP